MKLRQVDKATASSSATLAVNGIDNDSVYMVVVRDLHPSNDNQNLYVRVNVSSTAKSDAFYQESGEFLDSTTTNGDKHNLNGTSFVAHIAIGNAGVESANGIYMLYNFNDSGSYSNITFQNTDSTYNNAVVGYKAGGYRNKNESNNGLTWFFNTGNIEYGEVTLYEIVQ